MSCNCRGLAVNPAACNDSIHRHDNEHFYKPVNHYNNPKQCCKLYLNANSSLHYWFMTVLPVILPSAEE